MTLHASTEFAAQEACLSAMVAAASGGPSPSLTVRGPPYYPGDDGFIIPAFTGTPHSESGTGWHVPTHCAFPACGADLNCATGIMHAQRTATVGRQVAQGNFLALLARGFPQVVAAAAAPARPLLYCGRCRSVNHCSAACQKADWVRGDDPRQATAGTPFPAAVNWHGALHHHKSACRLMMRFFDRAAAAGEDPGRAFLLAAAGDVVSRVGLRPVLAYAKGGL